MPVKFYFWDQSAAFPSGHCSLEFDMYYVDFRVKIHYLNENVSMPSCLIHSKQMAYFESGLKLLAWRDLIAQHQLRVPASSLVYTILYQTFITKNNMIETFSNWNSLFNPLTEFEDQLNNEFPAILQAAIVLGKWLQTQITTSSLSYTDIITTGQPDHQLTLNELDIPEMKVAYHHLLKLQQDHKLIWFAKSGALNCHSNPNVHRPLLLRPIQYLTQAHATENGIYQHNCASFILALLYRGGIKKYLSSFNENCLISKSLQHAMKLNAQTTNTPLDLTALTKAGKLDHISRLLRACNFGPRAITDWFATLPVLVFEIVNHAQ